jgi:cellulose synthase/poly-beta-1,6-N-acetylglucosamine synthase-like glycosyltransferase
MTFEVHKKKLGKIIMDPKVYGNTQDPDNVHDYYKQVRRWHLGLWQTLRRHGFWASLFSVALAVYMAEVLLSTISLLLLPVALIFVGVVWLVGVQHVAPVLGHIYVSLTGPYNIVKGAGLLLVIDYTVSLLIGLIFKRPQYIWYGLGFMFMKYIDAWTFLAALPRAFLERSTGAWTSPARRAIRS